LAEKLNDRYRFNPPYLKMLCKTREDVFDLQVSRRALCCSHPHNSTSKFVFL